MQANAGPLNGLRVLDFTWVLAGPVSTRLLAYYGAEVIRVESTKRTDPVAKTSHLHSETQCGKLSIGLDVTHPEGRGLFDRLAQVSDVVADNYAAGVMDRLGLGYQALRRVNPQLIVLSMSAMGMTGPHSAEVAFGPNLHALAGIDDLTGYPDAMPSGIGVAYSDHVAGATGVVALLAAVACRERTGQGQFIDLSQFEALVSLLGPELLQWTANADPVTRAGNASPTEAPHGCYPCRGEDRWCVIAVSTNEEWAALCRAMGKPELSSDPRFATPSQRLKHARELDGVIEQWTSVRTPHEAMDALQRQGVAAGAVQDVEDLLKDPQLATRGFVQTVEAHWRGSLTIGSMPILMSGMPRGNNSRGPYLGEHNRYVFGDLLGLPEGEVTRLEEAKVIESVPRPPDAETLGKPA